MLSVCELARVTVNPLWLGMTGSKKREKPFDDATVNNVS